MSKHGHANGLDTQALASSGQLWRANTLGIIELREEPGQPIPRSVMKELLAMAAARGLWTPGARVGKR